MERYAFGIDVGGTTVKMGFFSDRGELLEKWEIPTDTSDHGANIIPDIASAVEEKLAENQHRITVRPQSVVLLLGK